MKLILLLTCLYGTFDTNESAALNEPGCGNRSIVRESKFIVGGRRAQMGEFPWMVALRFRRFGIHFCGGSLIKADFVLTAAHCIEDLNPFEVRVDAGIIDEWTGGRPYHQIRHPVRFIVHPKYDENTFENDIALMKLKRPFEISSHGMIGTICLTRKPLDNRKSIEVAGWGRLRHGGRKPDFLRTVVVSVQPNSKCYDQYEYFSSFASFCADVPGRSSCKGDSGGPAMQNEEGRTVQVGIVSYGSICGIRPAYYTRVSSYINWIEHSIGYIPYADA